MFQCTLQILHFPHEPQIRTWDTLVYLGLKQREGWGETRVWEAGCARMEGVFKSERCCKDSNEMESVKVKWDCASIVSSTIPGSKAGAKLIVLPLPLEHSYFRAV